MNPITLPRLLTPRTFGVLGAVLLTAGAFLPAATILGSGSVTMLESYPIIAALACVCAALGVLFAFRRRYLPLLATGLAGGLATAVVFVPMFLLQRAVRSENALENAGDIDPVMYFVVASMELGIGWWAILLGALLLVGAAVTGIVLRRQTRHARASQI